MNEVTSEYVRRMKQLKRIMQDEKEKYGHDQMVITIDDFVTMVDMVDQADEKTYFMVLVESEQPMVVTVKEREDRPNNIDAHSVLEKWITTNYNFKKYDYWDVSDQLKKLVIE